DFFCASRRRHTRSKRDWSQTCALPILGVAGPRRGEPGIAVDDEVEREGSGVPVDGADRVGPGDGDVLTGQRLTQVRQVVRRFERWEEGRVGTQGRWTGVVDRGEMVEH